MRFARAYFVLALAIGVAACSPSPPPAVPDSSAGSANGARLYSGNCAGCHQESGQGIPGVYPSLVGSPVVLGDPGVLAAWIVKGRRPPVTPAGRFPTIMPQFVWLRPEDVAALLNFLRSNFGNHAAPVDAGVVAKALQE